MWPICRGGPDGSSAFFWSDGGEGEDPLNARDVSIKIRASLDEDIQDLRDLQDEVQDQTQCAGGLFEVENQGGSKQHEHAGSP